MKPSKNYRGITVFYSYASADKQWRDQLARHLIQLKHDGLIEEWHDQQILAGSDRAQEIDQAIRSAQIILLLVSADFLASESCYHVEMQQALERHKEARVIPLLVRSCDWKSSPFAHLPYLPHNGKPVATWEHPDEAFTEIATAIRCIIEELRGVPGIPLRFPHPPEPTFRPASLSRAFFIEQQNRKRLIQRVRSFWIEGVFEQSLHHTALLTLELQKSPKAVENPWRLVLQESEHTIIPLSAGTRITETYDDTGGGLLILGEPGAGKTTLLLELTRELLFRAEQEPNHPLPVVFNLSSWTRKRQPLVTWLIEELEEKYQVPRKVGSDWVNTDQILPLLDGLDEVDATFRSACMQAINEYHLAHNLLVPLVVCCRVNEYLSQANRLALHSAVTIQPLTTEQINEYFAQVGERIASLHMAFQNDPVLQELATTPLMLSILILAYQDSPLEMIKGGVSTQVRQQQIFATYTQRMLRRRAVGLYSPQQTLHWLSYLAQQMKQQSQTIFSIERMQPIWLMKKWQRRFYHGLIAGPICGLFVEVAFPYLDGRPLFWLTIVMTAFIVGWLFGWVSEPETETKETKTIAHLGMCIQRRLAPILESRVMFGIMGGFLVGIGVALYTYLLEYPNWSFRMADTLSNGLGYGIFTGLFLGLAIKMERSIEPVEGLNWSWGGIRKNIARWLFIGMGTGLIVGMISALPLKRDVWLGYGLSFVVLATFQFAFFVMLTSGVIPGLSKRMLDAKHFVTPNQGTWRSVRHGAIMAAMTGVIFAIFIGASTFLALRLAPAEFTASIPSTLPGFCSNVGQGCLTWVKEQRDLYVAALFEVLTSAAILGLTAGLSCGGRAYLQHFVLRFLLWHARYTPFDYPRFLDYAAERALLLKVGGGYIFAHRLLCDYFAALDKPMPSEGISSKDKTEK